MLSAEAAAGEGGEKSIRRRVARWMRSRRTRRQGVEGEKGRGKGMGANSTKECFMKFC